MRRAAVTRNKAHEDGARIEALVLHVGRLLRHPAYRRERIISPLLLRHLPFDAGYAWHGEERLRLRLAKARLEAAGLEHMIQNARAELVVLRSPAEH